MRNLSNPMKKKRIFHMTKKNSGAFKRIISFSLIIMTLIALVFSLSACSGGKEKLDPQTKEELDADFVARVLSTDKNYQIRFLAASRGYDITSENFEDSKDDLGANVDFAKKVLDDVMESVRFDSDKNKETFENYRNALTEDTIYAVIESDSFNEKYDLDSSAGFPTILLVWIGKFLGLITNIVGDFYVLAILIFAILVEVLMLPMAVKQQKNSIGMAKLRPAIARIEKKYAGRTDQVTTRKKQEEIMELQQKSGYSPFSGCLPLIIQLIIVGFILYPIIQNPLRYVLNESTDFSNALLTYATAPQAAGGLGLDISAGNVMELLSSLNAENIKGVADFPIFENGSAILEEYNALSIPNFTAFGINLGRIPSLSFTNILILVPILNVVGQWFTMKLTRKWTGTGYNAMGGEDAQSKFSIKMMDVLPLLMTLFILFKVPAMIGIYWFFRSIISLGKQFIMQKVMPVPKYTAEEIKEMEKAAKERQKAQKEALKQQPKVRSLHYIDADDYDELPEAKPTPSSNTKKLGGDAPEIKD